MLKKILSVTGRPGLFRILSQGKGIIIVEELGTDRRLPVHARDKVVSLGDIAMYTESGDTPLGEILDKVYEKYEGKQVDVKTLVKEGRLHKAFEEVIADYDKERVHDKDIKKLFTWYNILTDAGFKKFVEKEETPKDENADSEEKEEK